MVQATAKGGSKVGKSGFRDLWLLTLTLIINAITVAVGLFQVCRRKQVCLWVRRRKQVLLWMPVGA